jgi:hypothetical protein
MRYTDSIGDEVPDFALRGRRIIDRDEDSGCGGRLGEMGEYARAIIPMDPVRELWRSALARRSVPNGIDEPVSPGPIDTPETSDGRFEGEAEGSFFRFEQHPPVECARLGRRGFVHLFTGALSVDRGARGENESRAGRAPGGDDVDRVSQALDE